MRQEVQLYHNDILALHQAIMFETLVYPHNIITDTVKSFVFEREDTEDPEKTEPLRGYLAMKEVGGTKVKYFIEDQFFKELPIRVNTTEELFLPESSNRKVIVLRPLDPTPFRIRPEKCFSTTKEFIDNLANFEHSNPDAWTLLKLTAVMGYVGKLFIGICSQSEFGKSSIYEILHSLTQKSPVFQPRSVPGVLSQITTDGNIVFDEVHESNKETKMCIENFTLQLGGNKPIYINGAMKTKMTKSKYDVSQQSLTFLYNVKEYYKNPDVDFFDYFFKNNSAINSRLLKIKLDGKLLEKFDRNFNLNIVAEENKMHYMKVAKYLLYLKDIKLRNLYKRRYDYVSKVKIKGRRKQIYDELTWLIDMYAEDFEEYKKFIRLLDKAIQDYKAMVSQLPEFLEQNRIEEEVVEESS